MASPLYHTSPLTCSRYSICTSTLYVPRLRLQDQYPGCALVTLLDKTVWNNARRCETVRRRLKSALCLKSGTVQRSTNQPLIRFSLVTPSRISWGSAGFANRGLNFFGLLLQRATQIEVRIELLCSGPLSSVISKFLSNSIEIFQCHRNYCSFRECLRGQKYPCSSRSESRWEL